MLRLHFTVADMAKTRVAGTLGPLAETILSLGVLRSRREADVFGPWRATARRGLSRAEWELAAFLRPFPNLGIDLFTLTDPAATVEEAQDALLRAPAVSVGREVQVACPDPRHRPRWLDGLQVGTVGARHRLLERLLVVHELGLQPYWPAVCDQLDAERARLERRVADAGIAGLLEALRPHTSWTEPTLEVPDAGPWSDAPIDCHLEGRGLVVVPSVFARRPQPYFPIDCDQPALLLVPVPLDSADARRLWDPDGAGTARPTAALLGRTRSAVLEAVATRARTTGELAAALDISPSSASQHATVLRAAGLLFSRREGAHVLHTATSMGLALVAEPADRAP